MLALVALVLALVLLLVFYNLGNNTALASALAGAVFLHLSIRPDFTQLRQAFLTAAGYALVYRLFHLQFGPTTLASIATLGALAGLGSLTTLAYQALLKQSQPDTGMFINACIVPLFSLAAAAAVAATQSFWPKTFDLYLYAFDRSLGVSTISAAPSWLLLLSTGTYTLFLVFPPLYRAWAVHFGIGREPSLLRAFLVAGVLGFVLNQICPATGPRYLYADALPSLNELTVQMTDVTGPRTAMPCIQAAWAFLLWWSAWRINWAARIGATFIVIFTVLAAIGSGDHYWIDVIVAVPFTLGVEGLCRRGYLAAGLGFGLTLGWFILLRSGFQTHSPELSWALVAATIVACVVCQIPLYRGIHTEEGLALSSRLTAMTGARIVPRPSR